MSGIVLTIPPYREPLSIVHMRKCKCKLSLYYRHTVACAVLWSGRRRIENLNDSDSHMQLYMKFFRSMFCINNELVTYTQNILKLLPHIMVNNVEDNWSAGKVALAIFNQSIMKTVSQALFMTYFIHFSYINEAQDTLHFKTIRGFFMCSSYSNLKGHWTSGFEWS